MQGLLKFDIISDISTHLPCLVIDFNLPTFPLMSVRSVAGQREAQTALRPSLDQHLHVNTSGPHPDGSPSRTGFNWRKSVHMYFTWTCKCFWSAPRLDCVWNHSVIITVWHSKKIAWTQHEWHLPELCMWEQMYHKSFRAAFQILCVFTCSSSIYLHWSIHTGWTLQDFIFRLYITSIEWILRVSAF